MPDDLNDLRLKIENIEQEFKAYSNRVEERYDAVQALVRTNGEKIAAIEGTITATKLISYATVIIVAVVGVLISVIGFSRVAKFAEQSDQMQGVLRSTALQNQISQVEKLDNVFEEVGYLDAFHNKDQATELKRIADQIREMSRVVDIPLRSNYYLVQEAINLYLDNNCDAANDKLKGVNATEQKGFLYTYLRSVCAWRTKHFEEATNWAANAALGTRTNPKRSSIVSSLKGTLILVKAVDSKNMTELDEAIINFDSSMRATPGYAPPYFNVASAYALKKEYKQTTLYIAQLLHNVHPPYPEVITEIHDDVIRPYENLLQNYVREYLCVRVPATDRGWRDEVEDRLRRIDQLPQSLDGIPNSLCR